MIDEVVERESGVGARKINLTERADHLDKRRTALGGLRDHLEQGDTRRVKVRGQLSLAEQLQHGVLVRIACQPLPQRRLANSEIQQPQYKLDIRTHVIAVMRPVQYRPQLLRPLRYRRGLRCPFGFQGGHVWAHQVYFPIFTGIFAGSQVRSFVAPSKDLTHPIERLQLLGHPG